MKEKIVMVKKLLFLLLLQAVPASAEVATYGYRVIESYPHDDTAFTQGLQYHDGYLYEGTGRRGQSSLSRLDLETGAVRQRQTLDRRYFGEGITIVNQSVYQLTWQSHMVFRYALEDFSLQDTLYNPREGWGLTYDGQRLVLSDGSDTLYFIGPESFETLAEIQVREQGRPVTRLNELEYIQGEIWANVWMTDWIVRIDPASGEVVSKIDLTGLGDVADGGARDAVLNGIAYDSAADRIFVTGKLWSRIFEIELVRDAGGT